MKKVDLINILDANREFITTKDALNKILFGYTTSNFIDRYLSPSDIINAQSSRDLVPYLLYCMTVDLIAINLKNSIVGKEWTQQLQNINYNLVIQDIALNRVPIITVIGQSTDKTIAVTLRFRISTYAFSFMPASVGDLSSTNLLDFPIMLGWVEGNEKKSMKLRDFTFSSFKEFLATLDPINV